ncbi:MAG: hypothetical protein K6F50_04275 [Kiritimatiellae bacterium]|nr:hypothetical protein [Kiritimatiellia bacterium]
MTDEQVSKASLKVEDFRKAVNYENTTNKGYVRFVRDGKGGVKISKVNNKVDFSIGLRTNITAAKNASMREKFASAMANDLRLADAGMVDALKARILKTKDGADRTDALSRKEIAAAFTEYDKAMNTATGRIMMVDRLLEDTAEKCGLGRTPEGIEALKKKYMTKQVATYMYEAFEGNPAGPAKMVRSELDFKVYLAELENDCKDAVVRAKLDSTLRSKAETFAGKAALDSDFGLRLSHDETAQIRGALQHFLGRMGLLGLDSGRAAGSDGMILETFMSEALPKLFRQGVESARAYDGGGNLAMDANFSYGSILEEAANFIKEAREFIDNPNEAPKRKSTGNAAYDEIIKNGEIAKAIGSSQVKLGTIDAVVNKILESTNITGKGITEIRKSLQGAIKTFDEAGRLGVFTRIFLAMRGIADNAEGGKPPPGVLEKTMEAIINDGKKAMLAARLQYGSSGKNEKGEKVALDDGIGDYLVSLENAVDDIASGKNGYDAQLVSRLMSYTMSNISSRKVEQAALGLVSGIDLGEKGLDADVELLKTTAEAYFTFEGGVARTLASERAAFKKLACAQFNRGLVTSDELLQLTSRANAALAQAHKEALKDFFVKSPVGDAAAGVAMLKRALSARLAEARAGLNCELSLNSIGNSIGDTQKIALKDVSTNVAKALSKLTADELKLGVAGVMGDGDAQAIISGGALRRLYHNTLAGKLKNIKTTAGDKVLDQAFVNGVQESFAKRVKELVESARTFRDSFMKECRTKISTVLENCIEEETGLFKGLKSCVSPIKTDEKKKLIGDMAGEVMRFKASQLKSLLGELLDAPEAFTKKGAKALATEFLEAKGPEETGQAIGTVARERKEMVDGWLAKEGRQRELENLFAEDKIFAKGGALEAIQNWEQVILGQQAANTVLARVKAMPLVYATRKESDLQSRVLAEIRNETSRLASKWMPLRSKIVKGGRDAESQCLSLGPERLAKAKAWALGEIFKNAKGNLDKLDVKAAVAFYSKEVLASRDYEIEGLQSDFAEYSEKIEKSLPAVKELIKDRTELALKRVDGTTASAEAKAYFKDVIIPKMAEKIESRFYRDPDAFASEKLNERKKEILQKMIFGFVNVGNAPAKLTGTEFTTLLMDCGLEPVAVDTSGEFEAARKDLETWLKSDEGSEKLRALEKAAFDYALEACEWLKDGDWITDEDALRKMPLKIDVPPAKDATPAKDAPPAKATPLAEFRAGVQKALHNHAVVLLGGPFDNEKVREAKEEFTKWVDSYGLSRNEDYRKTSAHDRIMVLFAERIHDLQEKALNLKPGEKNDAILSETFKSLVDSVIDSDGVQALISEWKAKQMKTQMDKVAQHEGGDMFIASGPKFEKLNSTLKAVVTRNNEDIVGAISVALTDLGLSADTTDGIKAVREKLEKITGTDVENAVKTVMALALERGLNRVSLAEGADKVIADYAHSIERQLIKETIGESLAGKNLKDGFIDLMTMSMKGMEKWEYKDDLPAVIANVQSACRLRFGLIYERAEREGWSIKTFRREIDAAANDFVNTLRGDDRWKLVLKPAIEAAKKNGFKTVLRMED